MFPSPTDTQVQQSYALAKEAYAALEINTDEAIQQALRVPISVHCWQGDDVGGFEVHESATDSGGIMATGGYPGRARNGDELRADLDFVLKRLPGVQRVNLHAFYAETDGKVVDRDALELAHFSRWMDWARAQNRALDFNPTYFAHPKAADGYTLSHPDDDTRAFWVRHGIASRRIAQGLAEALGHPAVNNQWIPDGAKDSPADRWSPRERLVDSLDQMFDEKLGVDPKQCLDSVESKLWGLGSEDYVVGSFEFYTGYALTRDLMLCVDMGHFHPTETIHDKLSALLQFLDRLLLHVSRPIRWDSDHVVILNDDLRQVFLELIRGGALDQAVIALDYFDASINRLAAYIVGARATRQALLQALLDPTAALQDLEAAGRGGRKLALMESMKTMPFGAVWDMLCLEAGVPPAGAWMADVDAYEETVLAKRG